MKVMDILIEQYRCKNGIYKLHLQYLT